jgi:hypothetical protein
MVLISKSSQIAQNSCTAIDPICIVASCTYDLHPVSQQKNQVCGERGSNTRPSDLQSDALPTELSPQTSVTGTRTRVAWVKARYPNHLDYYGQPGKFQTAGY